MPLLTWSLRKWNLVFICLLLQWDIGFLAKYIVDLLSTSNSTECASETFNSFKNDNNHKAWNFSEHVDMYSSSQLDKATTICFLEFYEIGELAKKKIWPMVLFLSTTSPLQSE